MTAIYLFLLKNPIARKIALVAVAAGALLYANKLTINHAYDQGRDAGTRAAYVQFEDTQKKMWLQAQADIKAAYDAAAKKADAVKQDREAFEKKVVVADAERKTEVKQVTVKIAAAEDKMKAAPVEASDNLPPKQVIIDTLLEYKNAYEIMKREAAAIQAEYDESTRLRNRETDLLDAKISAMQKDLDQTKIERDFYKDAFHKSIEKPHRSFGHILKKIFTLGIAR